MNDAAERRRAIESWSVMPAEAMAALDPEGDFAKKHLLNPTVLRMLGDVTGRRVLDAGCGQGYFVRLLARRGARVVGVEPAEGPYRYAVAKEAELQQGVVLIQADLVDAELAPVFDAIVVNMVFMAIPHWELALVSCVRALKPGGQFIFSIVHPCFEAVSEHWRRSGRLEVSEYLASYDVPGPTATDFHRPLSTYHNAAITAGLRLTEVVEPGLAPELAASGGPGAEALVHIPNFVIVSARREDQSWPADAERQR
jgi:2-polyprenyl-3-methyl-5-hydroxy-6-metoxy-1,4-benzoquinol methylase